MTNKRRTSLVYTLVSLLSLVSLAPLSGCAAFAAESARSDTLRARVMQYEYPQPCQLVWPTVQQVLAEKNFVLYENGMFVGQTNEVPDGTTAVIRYSAQAMVTAPGGCRVIVNRVRRWVNSTTEPSVERQFELELAILQRMDPNAAMAFQQEANQRGAEARAAYEQQKAAERAAKEAAKNPPPAK